MSDTTKDMLGFTCRLRLLCKEGNNIVEMAKHRQWEVRVRDILTQLIKSIDLTRGTLVGPKDKLHHYGTCVKLVQCMELLGDD